MMCACWGPYVPEMSLDVAAGHPCQRCVRRGYDGGGLTVSTMCRNMGAVTPMSANVGSSLAPRVTCRARLRRGRPHNEHHVDKHERDKADACERELVASPGAQGLPLGTPHSVHILRQRVVRLEGRPRDVLLHVCKRAPSAVLASPGCARGGVAGGVGGAALGGA